MTITFIVSDCLLIVISEIIYGLVVPVIWLQRTDEAEKEYFSLEIYEIVLLNCLTPLGAVISPLFLLEFNATIGRRNTLFMLSSVILVAEIGLAFTMHKYMSYITTFIIGFVAGCARTSISIFLSDICEDKNKSKIRIFIMRFIGVIFTLCLVITLHTPRYTITAISGIFLIFLLFLFFYLKRRSLRIAESILWLPVLSGLIFTVTYSLGLGVQSVALITQFFPHSMKTKAASLSTSTVYTIYLIFMSTFPFDL